MRNARGALLWLAISAGCAASTPTPKIAPAQLPEDQVVRRESLDQLGESLFAAVRDNAPESALAPLAQLEELLPPQTLLRVEQERTLRAGQFGNHTLPWRRAHYTGFCAQGAREERAGGSLGLNQNAWTLRRVLVAATVDDILQATWVEGRFLYTDQGWKVLSLSRIEPPRAHHSDLELAPCDVERGIR